MSFIIILLLAQERELYSIYFWNVNGEISDLKESLKILNKDWLQLSCIDLSSKGNIQSMTTCNKENMKFEFCLQNCVSLSSKWFRFLGRGWHCACVILKMRSLTYPIHKLSKLIISSLIDWACATATVKKYYFLMHRSKMI